ncbi:MULTISPECIES: AAA family ATPase [unclassified Fusobacterium]|uniref:ParA family protein n=1 Tax=unclassified Fusobacterium TaxID=2648384 RepID=UPI001B8AFEA8|nr:MULTISPECIES: AAA family ATPase [unclassified Fusobacterium]MBR8701044.1 hypothetical protein [Fusobacterium sp. DD45]MBR8710816.1 hypothetical protein [Fusobacterium sp. DD28]MBR8751406.1 hypothetical protein [Fusobacterium sp. DD26]
MLKKVSLKYNRKKNVLDRGKIQLPKDYVNFLNLDVDRKKFIFKFNESKIELTPFHGECEEMVRKSTLTKDIIFAKKIFSANIYKKNNSVSIGIPLFVLKQWNLIDYPYIDIKLYENKIEIKKYQKDSPKIVHKGIYVFKVEKGGIGKTFLSVQTASGLAMLLNKKTLLLTSDPQNNALDMCLPSENINNYLTYTCYNKEKYSLINPKGLKNWLTFGTGDIIKLRENLDYIPLESPLVPTAQLENQFVVLMEKLKKQYEYIIIDSVPTRKVDQILLNLSDKIIIPACGDKLTINGINKAIEEAGVEKVLAIIFNKFQDHSMEKKYYEEFKNLLAGTGIFFSNPIKLLSKIQSLVEKNKLIWESKAKNIIEVQEIIMNLLAIIVKGD